MFESTHAASIIGILAYVAAQLLIVVIVSRAYAAKTTASRRTRPGETAAGQPQIGPAPATPSHP